MYNRFVLNETSYHGAGAVKAVAEEITARGFKKAFVASDPDLIKFGVSKKVTEDVYKRQALNSFIEQYFPVVPLKKKRPPPILSL